MFEDRGERSSAEILSEMTGLPTERFEPDVEDYPTLDELQSSGIVEVEGVDRDV